MTSPPTGRSGIPAPGAADPRVAACIDRYWRGNLRVMAVLLSIWATVGFGGGILLADWLNQFRCGGFPLGFWLAHQGSIIAFVLLILAYAVAMTRLDRHHHEELQRLRSAPPPPAVGPGAGDA